MDTKSETEQTDEVHFLNRMCSLYYESTGYAAEAEPDLILSASVDPDPEKTL